MYWIVHARQHRQRHVLLVLSYVCVCVCVCTNPRTYERCVYEFMASTRPRSSATLLALHSGFGLRRQWRDWWRMWWWWRGGLCGCARKWSENGDFSSPLARLLWRGCHLYTSIHVHFTHKMNMHTYEHGTIVRTASIIQWCFYFKLDGLKLCRSKSQQQQMSTAQLCQKYRPRHRRGFRSAGTSPKG